MSKYNPCPFCGQIPEEIVEIESEDRIKFILQCQNCKVFRRATWLKDVGDNSFASFSQLAECVTKRWNDSCDELYTQSLR